MNINKALPLALALTTAAAVAGAAFLPAPFALAAGGGGKGGSRDEKVEKKIEIVLKVDGETLKLDEELAPGQSRSLRTESGEPATVRRDGNELVISVGGKEKRVKVLSADGEGLAFGAGPSCMKLHKGRLGGKVMTIDSDDDGPMTWCMAGLDAEDCIPGMCDPLAHVDLDELKSMKVASADLKAKVREVLDEIRKSRKARKTMTFEKRIVLGDGDDDEKIVIHGGRDGKVQKKVIVMVDGDDDDDRD